MKNTTHFSGIILCLLLMSGKAIAEVENWYAHIGLGSSSFNHPDSVMQSFALVENANPNIHHDKLGMDILGVYFPVTAKTSIGGAISGDVDAQNGSGLTYQLATYLAGVSAMHFMGKEIGDGLFFRADIGRAQGNWVRIYEEPLNGVYMDSTVTSSGIGYLLGIGYGVPLSQGTRILLSLNVTNKRLDGETFKSTRTMIGFYW